MRFREKDDPYYDLFEDFDLIAASFQAQYGLRLSKDLDTMRWDEFRGLLSGIGPETPLGRIVAIRAENDKDILKHFTREQHRIRSQWRRRQAEAVTGNELDQLLESLKQAFVDMAGGGRY